MTVADILRFKGSDVTTIADSTSIRDAASILREKNIGALLVNDENGRPRGLVTEREIVHHVAERGSDMSDVPVSEVLQPAMRTCREDDSVRDAMEVMTVYRARHLPVTDELQHVVGIISIGDVIKHRLNELETEKNVLRDIVTAAK
jgi:CBS domain-containing protein